MALFLGNIAVSHYLAGRYGESHRYASEAVRVRPGFYGAHRLRCTSLARIGRVEEARSLLAMLRSEQSQLSIAWIRANVPYQTPELMDRFLEGMRMAGSERTLKAALGQKLPLALMHRETAPPSVTDQPRPEASPRAG